ncbi:NUDIX hydrolase [Kitasatospora sp. NPDC028055]|uniref:NUDIX hydrolase n=1 Tax=Kitasatospora sp. NPDC028055 TaxID=3155653 RepID=UPI0033E3FCF8
MSWTSDALRQAAWTACVDMATRPPIAQPTGEFADAPSQVCHDVNKVVELLTAVTAAGPPPLVGLAVGRALKALEPARVLAEEFDCWQRSLPAKHTVGGQGYHWPRHAELLRATQEAFEAMHTAHQVLDDLARTQPLASWTTLDSEVVHPGARLTLYRDQVLRPDGERGVYEHVRVRDAVRVVALDPAGNIALVEDAFYLQGTRVVHLPGGGIDAGERVEEAAVRELEEETGWSAGRVETIGAIHPLPSSTRAITHLLLATDLVPGTLRRDATEAAMTAHWHPFHDAVDLVTSGVIREAGSVAAILLADRLLKDEAQ